jgi:protein transport protein DSL1/ZW10
MRTDETLGRSPIQPVLPKSKYYALLGLIVDTATSRLLSDILALPDITEVESHQLAELCRGLVDALEGVFIADHVQVCLYVCTVVLTSPNTPLQSSFAVAYVPNWLKFSYLIELLVSRRLRCLNSADP